MKLNRIEIPSAFMLHGQRYTVSYSSTLCAKDSERGHIYHNYGEIVLQKPKTEGEPMPPSMVEQAFFHELVHGILDHMESDKDEDERFVNLFANLLHEAMITSEYGK